LYCFWVIAQANHLLLAQRQLDYISSLTGDAKQILYALRGYWSVEMGVTMTGSRYGGVGVPQAHSPYLYSPTHALGGMSFICAVGCAPRHPGGFRTSPTDNTAMSFAGYL
jgi:hypothetical protein